MQKQTRISVKYSSEVPFFSNTSATSSACSLSSKKSEQLNCEERIGEGNVTQFAHISACTSAFASLVMLRTSRFMSSADERTNSLD
jgi:hypothetical protein